MGFGDETNTAVKTDTAAIKAVTDLLPNAGALSTITGKTNLIPASPAAVGSAMTLTAAYDKAKTAAQVAVLDIWGALQASAEIPAVAADVALPSVAIPNFSGIGTLYAAFLMIKFSKRVNAAAGVNKLSGAQNIQAKVGGAGYVNAMALVDDMLHTIASGEGPGDVIIGAVDISGFTGFALNTTLDCKLANGLADAAVLTVYDIQMGVRLILES